MLRETVKGSMYMSISWFCVKALSFFYMAIIARALGPKGLGTLSIALALTPWFIMFASLSLQTTGTHIISKYRGEKKEMSSVIKSIAVIALCGGLIAALVHFLIAPIVASVIFHDETLTKYFQLTSLIIFLSVIYYAYIGILRGFKRFGAYATIDVVKEIVVVVLGIMLVYFFKLNVVGAIVALIASHGVLLLFNPARGVKWLHAKAAPVKPIIMNSLWFAVVGLILSLIINMDKFVLGFLQSKETVGLYASALSLFGIGTFFSSSIKNSMLPVLSEYIAKTKEFKNKVMMHYIHKVLYYTIIVAGFFMFAMLALGKEVILILFGKEYSGAQIYLNPLLFALIFFSMYLLAHTLMISFDRLKIATAMCFITLIVAAACMYMLTKFLGALGTAYSFILIFILLDIGYYNIVFRDIVFNWRKLGMLIGITMGIGIVIAQSANDLIGRILLLVGSCILYAVMLMLGKYIEKREVSIVIKKMFSR